MNFSALQQLFLKEGSHKLSNSQLLSLLLRDEAAIETHTLISLFNSNLAYFVEKIGLNKNTYTCLQAALALTQRYLQEQALAQRPLSTAAVRSLLLSHLTPLHQEACACLWLDKQLTLLHFEIPQYGKQSQLNLSLRQILSRALTLEANYLIFAHNHPSGALKPSKADLHFTQKLADALKLIDVELLDHYLIANNRLLSFIEQGFLQRSLY